MKVSTLDHNGEVGVILIPENDLDREILKQVEGGEVNKVTDGQVLFGTNLTDSLIILKKTKNEKTDSSSSNATDRAN